MNTLLKQLQNKERNPLFYASVSLSVALNTLTVNNARMTTLTLTEQRLTQYILAEFKKTTSIDLSQDRLALDRLEDEVRDVVVELSISETVDINLPFIMSDQNGPKHLNMKLNRTLLESLGSPVFSPPTAPAFPTHLQRQLAPGEQASKWWQFWA